MGARQEVAPGIGGRREVGVRIIQGEGISGSFQGQEGHRDAQEVEVIAAGPEGQPAGEEYATKGTAPACHNNLESRSQQYK
jgi:hypothetical protein